jgi:hypothetical protein
MKATGWKGKVLGVRVGVENRPQYFGRNWAQRDGAITAPNLISWCALTQWWLFRPRKGSVMHSSPVPVMHYIAASSSLMVLPAGSCMARSPSKLWSRQIAGRRRRLSSYYLTREPGFPL